MDLGLVKKKVNEGKYKSIHEAAEDVRLIWKNCMTYNADGSDFYNLAQVRHVGVFSWQWSSVHVVSAAGSMNDEN